MGSSPELLAATWVLQQDSGYSFYDSLMPAAALQAGAATVYTEDLQHQLLRGSLRIVNPFLDRVHANSLVRRCSPMGKCFFTFPPIPPAPFPPQRGRKGEQTATFGVFASATTPLATSVGIRLMAYIWGKEWVYRL